MNDHRALRITRYLLTIQPNNSGQPKTTGWEKADLKRALTCCPRHRLWFSPRSGRQHKAWGESRLVGRNPRITSEKIELARGAGRSPAITQLIISNRLQPAPRGGCFFLLILGVSSPALFFCPL